METLTTVVGGVNNSLHHIIDFVVLFIGLSLYVGPGTAFQDFCHDGLLRNPRASTAPSDDSESRQLSGLSGGLGLGAMAAVVHDNGGFFAAGAELDVGTRNWQVHIELPNSAATHPGRAHTVEAPRSDR